MTESNEYDRQASFNDIWNNKICKSDPVLFTKLRMYDLKDKPYAPELISDVISPTISFEEAIKREYEDDISEESENSTFCLKNEIQHLSYTQTLIKESMKIFREKKLSSIRETDKQVKHNNFKLVSLENDSKSSYCDVFPRCSREPIKQSSAGTDLGKVIRSFPDFSKERRLSRYFKTALEKQHFCPERRENDIVESVYFMDNDIIERETMVDSNPLEDSDNMDKRASTSLPVPRMLRHDTLERNIEAVLSEKALVVRKKNSDKFKLRILQKIFRKKTKSLEEDIVEELRVDETDEELLVKYNVAVLVPNFSLEDFDDAPESLIGVIMSAFDCLNPYEQLMLKCGSIIGDTFTRKMLNALMHNPNQILTSMAVKRLYEMRIIQCGSNHKKKTVLQQSQQPRQDSQVKLEKILIEECFCELEPHEVNEDLLPKYAYCKVLHFRYSLFRSTLYELLPGNQKKEFHIRAVEFLESETPQCYSCTSRNSTDAEKLEAEVTTDELWYQNELTRTTGDFLNRNV